jgi:hypothetical protein
VQQEEREQPQRLGLVRHEDGEQLAQADGLVAEVAAHEPVAAGRRVALVEEQVDDGEHGAEALGEQVVRGHAKGDARLADAPLGAHEPLRKRRLGDEEGARDLTRGEAGHLAQREREARLGRQRGMAAGEDEREPLVGDRAHVILLGGQGL